VATELLRRVQWLARQRVIARSVNAETSRALC
jgi:hypothetical protein